jgi:hypothetical protein
MRFVLVMISIFFGALGAYYGQPYVTNNPAVTSIIVTTITVFAGFLVAIISIVGDPSLIPGHSWRSAEIRRENIELQLIRHSWLFTVYLVAIALLFVSELIRDSYDITAFTKMWIERLYLFFSFTSFFLTFGLPISIRKLQMKRFDAEVEKRREQAGIENDEPKKGNPKKA